MKRTQLKLAASALTIALLVPLGSQADAPAECPRGGPGGHFHGGPGPFSADRLPPYLDNVNLSDAQRSSIKDILKTKGEVLQSKRQDNRDDFAELRKLAFSSDYSAEKAKSLIEAMTAQKSEMALLHAEMDHAIFLVLTPEQQKQIKDQGISFPGRHWKNR